MEESEGQVRRSRGRNYERTCGHVFVSLGIRCLSIHFHLLLPLLSFLLALEPFSFALLRKDRLQVLRSAIDVLRIVRVLERPCIAYVR